MLRVDLLDRGDRKSGSGPPNRINDLSYTEWMKFQKSFFWFQSDQEVVDQNIQFFTKARYPDGTPSRTLVIGFPDYHVGTEASPRRIEHSRNARIGIAVGLHGEADSYDFIMVDLRKPLEDDSSLVRFLTTDPDGVFSGLRKCVKHDKYCGVFVDLEKPSDFPIPWAVALAGRAHLRLRDEKIGLFRHSRKSTYALYFQSVDDARPPNILTPGQFRYGSERSDLPTWLIPRPPPRRKGELLHPAKFPETLVSQFIELFTKRGDTILDPMVGTGSAVLAALRTGRSGIGLDLIPRFVNIAKQRILNEFPSPLLESHPLPSFKLIVGDATKLLEIAELRETKVDYCITSPPYWSVLSNPGSEYQRSRRERKLPLVYSGKGADIGNVGDYNVFIEILTKVYEDVAHLLNRGSHLTVVVKNLKRKHLVYPLAWDLTFRLARHGGHYQYLGTSLWCQDDISIKPFAVGTHWVSNVLHHYCLHFRRI